MTNFSFLPPDAARFAAVTPRSPASRVLLVEDNGLVRELEAEILTEVGLEVRIAPDGEKAWDLLRESPESFSLVITDIAMPRMNGLEFARNALRLRPDLRILLVSGALLPDEEFQAFPAGSTAFLQKPFRPQAFEAAIARLRRGEQSPGCVIASRGYSGV